VFATSSGELSLLSVRNGKSKHSTLRIQRFVFESIQGLYQLDLSKQDRMNIGLEQLVLA